MSNTNPNTEKTPMTPEERKETVGRVLLVLRWVVCVICIIEVIAFFPSISCIFWALAAVLLLPIRKIRDFIKSKVPQKPVRVAAGVAAGIAALSLSPAPETDVEITPETDAPETAYTILAETETETEAETRAETETETKAETKTTEETEPKKPSAVNSLLAGLTAAITGMTETEPEAEAEPEKTMPETKAPEPETKADTAPPETKAPETKAPETKAPETKAPETKAPEKKPPETKAPEKTITITHKDSSLSLEMVKALEGVAAFWAPTGSKIHLDPFCWTMQGVVYAGTVEEANRVKDGGWCGSCSKGANENTKSNVNATPEVIANCYSLSDYQNQIPAEAYN